MSAAATRYRFGPFELQLDERRLLKEGTATAVRPHAFEVLSVLVGRAGRLVTKDELFEHVWGKVVVEENTLQAHISALRKVLGTEAIATVSGQGYRFAMDVAPVSEPPAVAAKHNLPHSLTSFIGRAIEIGQVRQWLRSTRLLTLTGAGGCGKTRLALHAARELVDDYPDGVWFVELAPVSEASHVARTVARTLAVKEEGGRDAAESVAECLASRRMLLVLDNAEHVLDACGQLTDLLLRRCGGLSIVTTSRERLGIAGELVYRVPSLGLPPADGLAASEEILACEAVRLFVDRAHLLRPDLDLTARDAAALASICRRLDGIALAIELAAPQVRVMSMQEIAARLDDRLSLLTGGSPAAQPRHRTLRSLIDWSHDLLTDEERALLRRASVFAGGWTLEAAERVCDGTLEVLASLADKNLVVAEPREKGTRFSMLETVRDYARERLRECGEERVVGDRHLEYFTLLAEASPELDPESNGVLEGERDNIRAALTRCVAGKGEFANGLRLASLIAWFWVLRGYYAEGRAWISALLAAAPADMDKAKRASMLGLGARFAQRQGDYPSAKAQREEQLAIGRELGDRSGISQTLMGLGVLAWFQGRFDDALGLYDEAGAILRDLGDIDGLQRVLIQTGSTCVDRGDFARARSALEECIALSGAQPTVRKRGAQYNLGLVEYYEGHLAAARRLLEGSLAARREAGEVHGVSACLIGLARVAFDEGDVEGARRMFAESLEIDLKLGEPRALTDTLEALAPVALLRAGPGPAARLWGASQRIREEHDLPVSPCDQARYDADVTRARAAMRDDAAFDREWNEGRRLTPEEAAQYGLGI